MAIFPNYNNQFAVDGYTWSDSNTAGTYTINWNDWVNQQTITTAATIAQEKIVFSKDKTHAVIVGSTCTKAMTLEEAQRHAQEQAHQTKGTVYIVTVAAKGVVRPKYETVSEDL